MRMLSLRAIVSAAAFAAAPLLTAAGATAAVIDYTTNLALSSNDATPIMGYASSPTGAVAHVQTAPADNLNDGNTANGNYETTHANHWLSENPDSQWIYDYAGVTWATAQDDVAAVRLYIRKFNDGGWFATPAANDPDTADTLAFAPQVQYSTDGGATWIAAANQTTDYDAATTFEPATFTFDPVSGINALRIIGDGWGPSGNDPTGFLGVREFEAFAAIPEPASLALIALGGAAMLRRRPGRA